MSDTGRQKTVVTAISKISDRPVAKEACLVVIYGMELGKKYNLNRPQIIIGRSSKADIQIDRSEFNVRYGSGSFFDSLGDKTIYDEFDLSVSIVATGN